VKKLFAVIKREYIQRVRTKFFVISTVLGPLMMAAFGIVPALMFGIRAGGPTRLAIVDQTDRMYTRVALEINSTQAFQDEQSSQGERQPSGTNSDPTQRAQQIGRQLPSYYAVEQVTIDNRSIDDLKKELNGRVQTKQLDGYVVLPADLLQSGQPEYHARNTADLFTRGHVASAISRAVSSQRMAEANIDEKLIRRMREPVHLRTFEAGGRGGESKGEGGFYLVFSIGLLIYVSVLLYGQLVLGAVIEEKETRIAEILFSSMRSFPLMMGKLIGVSLVALTQLAIWALAFIGVSVWAGGSSIPVPHISPMILFYFVIYFLMGYFIYATIYAVVGSMVTTTQEGGQLALPIVFMLVAGLLLSFNIIRSPNSSLAFWASMFPLFSPITMLVRIVTETPPLWQILLSLGIGFGTATGLIWLASRIYRVGMLMYGKKATIPEVVRWVRQS
jgi:ABC-2 type transport system permease protein